LYHLRNYLSNPIDFIERGDEALLLVTISDEFHNAKYAIDIDYFDEVWRSEGNVSVSYENLVEELENLLWQLYDLLTYKNQTSIEFRVPHKLISFEFETIKIGHDAEKIGKMFPVVVRINRPPHTQPDWIDKWNQIQECCTDPANSIMKEFNKVEIKSSDGLESFSDALFPFLKFDPKVELPCWSEYICDHGTPVALWPRISDAPQVNIQTFDKLNKYFDAPLRKLPAGLKKIRKIYYRFPEHVGGHLILLWDDPDHLPKYDNQVGI
jgi:hypothetical protein